jgi:hypothetical protein
VRSGVRKAIGFTGYLLTLDEILVYLKPLYWRITTMSTQEEKYPLAVCVWIILGLSAVLWGLIALLVVWVLG